MQVTTELVPEREMVSSCSEPPARPNSLPDLRVRLASGKLSWLGPSVVLVSRTAFMVLAQGLVAIVFLLRGTAHPWLAAGPWWTVYGTLVDVGCLSLLWRFTHLEGISLRDLIGRIRLRYGRDLFSGFGVFFLVFPFFVVGGLLSCRLIYGAYQVNAFPGILSGRVLPLWAVIYSHSLWWIIWSPTEEMTYAGYLLPRIQALSKRTWVAVLLVGFVWAIQHSFLPFLPEWRNFVWRFLAFVPGVAMMSFIYLRMRRLGPLIIAHWSMDILATIMTMQ